MLSNFKNLLSTRDFKNLWFGQAISRIGDAFYYIGPLFVIKKIFNDDSMVGYVGALESIPYLFMGPIAGAIADRFDRKKIMIWADVLSALILFVFLAYLLLTPGNPPRWPFYVFGPLLAACRVFFFPAKDATIPRVLPAEKLMDGNSLNASTDQTMWLVGNMLTASFSSIADFYGAKNFLIIMVFINAITFLGSVYYLSLLPSVVPERKEPHEEGMLVDVIKGIEYAKRDKVIGLSLLATVGLSFFMSPFMVL
jgi:MFS family permease